MKPRIFDISVESQLPHLPQIIERTNLGFLNFLYLPQIMQ